jgi:hypothetical protein
MLRDGDRPVIVDDAGGSTGPRTSGDCQLEQSHAHLIASYGPSAGGQLHFKLPGIVKECAAFEALLHYLRVEVQPIKSL